MHVHNHTYVSHNTHLSQVSKSPHVSRKLENIMVDAPLSHICFPSQQTFHLYRKKTSGYIAFLISELAKRENFT